MPADLTATPGALAVTKEQDRRDGPETAFAQAYLPALAKHGQETRTEPRRLSRYEEEKKNPRARRVRSPRFSDEEWERVKKQAGRMTSQTDNRYGLVMAFLGRQQMTALELVRVATMACVQLLEDVPHGNKPPKLWDVLKDPSFRGALVKRLKELDDAEHAARWGSSSARNARHLVKQQPTANVQPKPQKKSPPQPKRRSSR